MLFFSPPFPVFILLLGVDLGVIGKRYLDPLNRPFFRIRARGWGQRGFRGIGLDKLDHQGGGRLGRDDNLSVLGEVLRLALPGQDAGRLYAQESKNRKLQIRKQKHN